MKFLLLMRTNIGQRVSATLTAFSSIPNNSCENFLVPSEPAPGSVRTREEPTICIAKLGLAVVTTSLLIFSGVARSEVISDPPVIYPDDPFVTVKPDPVDPFKIDPLDVGPIGISSDDVPEWADFDIGFPSQAEDRANGAPLVIDQQTHFRGANGEPVMLAAGYYYVAETNASPLVVRSETSGEEFRLAAEPSAHGASISLSDAQYIPATAEQPGSHIILMMPDGSAIDASSIAGERVTPERLMAAFGEWQKDGIRIDPTQWHNSYPSAYQGQLKPRMSLVKPVNIEYLAGRYRNYVVVKFRDGPPIRVGYTQKGKPTLKFMSAEMDSQGRRRMRRQDLTGRIVREQVRAVKDLIMQSRPKGVRPLFSRAERFLRHRRALAEAITGKEHADLGNYYSILLRTGYSGETLVDQLNALNIVEIAYLQAIPVTTQAAPGPVVNVQNPTPDLTPFQGYLNAADAAISGVNARFSWNVPGGRGEDVRLYDVDSGWNLNHEDMPSIFKSTGWGALEQARDTPRGIEHGTKVLGVIGAPDNGFGITGIASEAEFAISHNVICVDLFGLGVFCGGSMADAIDTAASDIEPGDVILIELGYLNGTDTGQICNVTCNGSRNATTNPNGCPATPGGAVRGTSQFRMTPAEWQQADFDAIEAATSVGIIVVETAGNGSMNLDSSAYNGIFDTTQRDSGAIMVGAGSAGNSQPMCFTNFGQRVDVHAWGTGVVTAGLNVGNPANSVVFESPFTDNDRIYDGNFNGTSSAGAIVAGAVTAIQGAWRATSPTGLNSIQMRNLLVLSGTPQTIAAATTPIGPQPDIRGTLVSMGWRDIPAGPSNLTVTNTTGTTATLNWTHHADAGVPYYIIIDGGTALPPQQAPFTASVGPNQPMNRIVTDLVPDTAYTFSVVACVPGWTGAYWHDDCSVPSNEANGTTLDLYPPEPTGFQVTSMQVNLTAPDPHIDVSLMWNPPQTLIANELPVTEWELSCTETCFHPSQETTGSRYKVIVDVNTRNVTVDTLPKKRYYFNLKGCNVNPGNGDRWCSDAVRITEVTPEFEPAPAWPTGLTLTTFYQAPRDPFFTGCEPTGKTTTSPTFPTFPGEEPVDCTPNAVRLNWTDNANNERWYVVQWAVANTSWAPTGGSNLVPDLPGNAPGPGDNDWVTKTTLDGPDHETYVFTPLQSGQLTYFRVLACNYNKCVPSNAVYTTIFE